MKKPRHTRRGTMYVAVLGCMSMIAVIGVTALTVGRIEMRSASGTTDLTEARFYAQSAVEMGARILKTDPNWRTTMTNGRWKTNVALGEGTYSLDAMDPIDATLSNSKTEPVRLTGTGTCRQATYILQATAMADRVPLDILRTALHAGGDVTVQGGQSLTATGGPLSTNGTLNNSGTIVGNVEAAAVAAQGTVTGTLDSSAAAKLLPDPGVFDFYQAMATTIAYPGTITKQVLAPGVNPWGAANPDGVYYIDAGANDLTITKTRIHGTLLVRCSSGYKVVLQTSDFFQNYRSDYPVLIVDGTLDIQLNSATLPLVELANQTNYNPDGAAYQGVADADELDSYPNEVHGLVHARQVFTAGQSSRIVGVVIAEDAAIIRSSAEVVHDPSIYSNPPTGYETYEMNIAPGSWQRVVLP